MSVVRAALVYLMLSGIVHAAASGELEQAYLTVCERIVQGRSTNAFSICVEAEPPASGSPAPFHALPAGFWGKLKPLLEPKGLNMAAYVPCEEVRRVNGQVVHKETGLLVPLYVIERVERRGDGRLVITWARRLAPLSERGGTLILELKEGRWVIAEIAGGWIS